MSDQRRAESVGDEARKFSDRALYALHQGVLWRTVRLSDEKAWLTRLDQCPVDVIAIPRKDYLLTEVTITYEWRP